MQPTSTRIPHVVDAIIAMLGAALPGWTIFDGPPVGAEWPMDFVAVAQGPGAVTSETEYAEGLGDRLVETFQVRCLVSTLSGDEDMRPRRDAACAVLDAVDAAIRADLTLGGACDVAARGPLMEMETAQTGGGATWEIAFTVAGRTYL